MNDSAYSMMGAMLKEHLPTDRPLSVLDVGSFDVNGTYRPLMAPGWTYSGCDIAPGPNVDIVQLEMYRIQELGGAYDAVISGQCMEHVEQPWMLVPEMARMLKPGGVCIISAPWQFHIHRFPVDCWRILPDGMDVLLRLAALTAVRPSFTHGSECWGIGKKP